jgi:hypothetical protein
MKKGKIGKKAWKPVGWGKKWRGWRWDILPQEGMVHLAIYRVTVPGKSFLAYSGIGDGVHCSELTNLAMTIAAPLAQGNEVFLDIRQRVTVDWRVISAFAQVEKGGLALFMSEKSEMAGEVNAFIQQGQCIQGEPVE